MAIVIRSRPGGGDIKMKFREIVEKLSNTQDITMISGSGESEISRVRLWDSGERSGDKSTLYFSYDSQMPSFPANCIIASDKVSETHMTSQGNLAAVPFSQFISSFNKTQDLITDHGEKDFYKYMMEVANHVRDVDALIDVASLSFNASLILIDRDYRILCYSTQVPVVDKLWAENINRGYCDYEFIQEVQKLKSIKTADSSSNPIEVTCKSSPFRKLASRVFCKDSHVGSLILIEGDNTYRPEHVEMLRTLSGVTGYSILAHSPELIYRTSEYHSFLYNVIIGAPLSAQPEAFRNLEFPSRVKAVYFRPDEGSAAIPKEAELSAAIHTILPGCHVISHRKAAIVLYRTDTLADPGVLLDCFPEECNVRAGLSNSFDSIEDLEPAIRESKDALKIGKSIVPGKRIFSFENLGVYVMLRHLSESEDIQRYYHPAMNILTRYDSRSNTSLLPTLETYLDNNCSIKDTVDALFMHRNSVIYRLRKIEELCSIDLTDTDTCFRLRLSFAIRSAINS